MEFPPVPPLSAEDIAAMKARYRVERDKRLRPEGGDQYVEAGGAFGDFAEVDQHGAPPARPAISEDTDVVVVGAGFAGIMAGVRLKQAGVTNFRIIDTAAGFGGVWYWNNYPGIQCDNEAYCYMLMLDELNYVPKNRFADGVEIREHCERIGSHFGLYDQALFGTAVTALQWDESINRWLVSTSQHDDIRARFVIMCVGSTNKPKLPGIPGIHEFKGHSFHSARWDYDYTGGTQEEPNLHKLADKRVAIIGTGASAIQIVPFLGRDAQHLYVFQRTPSSVDRRNNMPTDPKWAASLKPGWQKERQKSFHEWSYELDPRTFETEDVVRDFWTEVNRNMHERMAGMASADISVERFWAMREEEDFRVMERLRRRVDGIVQDPQTAEALKPYYRMGCKRPCSNDNYLEMFNQPNVTLVDVSQQQGVERITEKGIVANGIEYEVDCIIFASGFEVTTRLDRRLGIRPYVGREGTSLYDYWADGLQTFHGMLAHRFPNHFYTGFTQAGVSGNITNMYDQQVSHISWIIKEALARGLAVVEPTQEAQDGWGQTIRDTAIDVSDFLLECTPGYWNGEGGGTGTDEERRKKLRFIFGEPYSPGFYPFEELLKNWREAGDMKGLELTPDTPANL